MEPIAEPSTGHRHTKSVMEDLVDQLAALESGSNQSGERM